MSDTLDSTNTLTLQQEEDALIAEVKRRREAGAARVGMTAIFEIDELLTNFIERYRGTPSFNELDLRRRFKAAKETPSRPLGPNELKITKIDLVAVELPENPAGGNPAIFGRVGLLTAEVATNDGLGETGAERGDDTGRK